MLVTCRDVSAQEAPAVEAAQLAPHPVAPTAVGIALLRQAGKVYLADKTPKGSPEVTNELLLPEQDLERQRATVARHAETLRLLRQALESGVGQRLDLALTDPNLKTTDALGRLFDQDYKAVDGLGRLLAQESRVHAADGEWELAAASALDLMTMAIQFPRGGSMLASSFGRRIESNALRELRRLEPHLPATTLKLAASRLLELDKARVSLEEMIRDERAYGLAMLGHHFEAPEWKNRPTKYDELPQEAREELSRAQFDAYASKNEIEIVAEYTEQTERLLQWARQTPSQDWRKLPALPEAKFVLTRFADQLWQTTVNRFGLERASAAARLVATRMAARAFRREHGEWPGTLSELVPLYLPAVPVDPFSGRPLLWKTGAEVPLLYSVGSDGVDDGGAPARTERQTATAGPAGLPPRAAAPVSRSISADSQGDFLYTPEP